MANKFDTEIITDAEVVEVDFNPLDEAVNEKKYTQPNVTATSIDINTPISEPTFTPPPFQKKVPKPEEQKKREPLNSDLKDLPKKDKEMSAKAAAKMILQGYEWIHTLANKGLQVSEKKLNKLQQEGEINLNALIDYEYGKRMSAGEFFEEYNRQVEGVLVVTEEFKEEVTPVLERVLEKRGIGLTDEQTLMFMFGKDIAAKSLIFFQQRQVLNNMIENIKIATMQQQRQFQAQQQQFQPQYQPQPQYQAPQQAPQQQAPPQEPQAPIVQAEPKDAGSYEFTKEYQEEQFVAKSKKTKKDGEVVVLPEPKKRRKKI
jgi:hypothetical protein